MVSNLVIFNTSRCNLKCGHCLRGNTHPQHDIPLEIVSRLLQEAKSLGIYHFSLTGGEPGLQHEFDQMVNMIVQAGYSWSIVTNGFQYNIYEKALTQYGNAITRISVSLDGASPVIHDGTRGSGSFKKTIAAAKYYVESGYTLYIATCFTKRNLYEFEAIAKLTQDLGASRWIIMSAIPTDWNYGILLSDLEKTALYNEIRNLKNDFGMEIVISSSLITNGGVNFCSNLQLNELAVNHFGELIFCCDTIGKGAVIGSLHSNSLAELIPKWLFTSMKLKGKRLEDLKEGKISEDFDTCAYCNAYFNEQNGFI